jgi:DNA-binding transcriptional LysR family regulator
VNIRFAKPHDANALAEIHLSVSGTLSDSLIPQLGRGFLVHYYRMLLDEPHSVVMCAVDLNRQVLGFASGSTDAPEHTRHLKANRLRLLLGALPALLAKPGLAWTMKQRGKASLSHYKDGESHSFFWAWKPGVRPVGGAVILFNRWLAVMRLTGNGGVFIDVDKQNDKVATFHRKMGAVVIEEPSGSTGGWRMVYQSDKPYSFNNFRST